MIDMRKKVCERERKRNDRDEKKCVCVFDREL